MTLSDLTSIERDVITSLAGSRVTASAVTVAADLWVNDDASTWGRSADPTGLAAFVIEGLGERGLVSYVLRESPGTFNPWHGLPMQIRLTPEGWAAAGFPQSHGHVGHGSRHSRDNVKHLGDMTNYRNHPDRARGLGDIVKEDFPTHRSNYPHHIHDYGDTYMEDTRTYTRVTPELEASVIFTREQNPTMTYREIAEYLSLPERQVRYVLTDRPRLRGLAIEGREGMSLKERMLMCIREVGPIENVISLKTLMASGDDLHNLTHVLYSLQKEGTITWDATRLGDQVTDFKNIRMQKRLSKRRKQNGSSHTREIPLLHVTDLDSVESIPAPVEEPTPAVDLDALEEPTPDILPGEPKLNLDAYPVLRGLIEAERGRMAVAIKSQVYLDAAESLSAIDPEEGDRLIAKAAAMAPPAPSDVESEYLRLVRDLGIDVVE